MPELFRLEKEEFSEEYNENWWTYSVQFEFTFNNLTINCLTITDHSWKKKGRGTITQELILNIFRTEINGKRFFPTDYQGLRRVFLREGIFFGNKKYKLVFWFKDNTTNHLWVRNCHEQD